MISLQNDGFTLSLPSEGSHSSFPVPLQHPADGVLPGEDAGDLQTVQEGQDVSE